METEILELLGAKDYVPANVPELLSDLELDSNQQQALQRTLKELERSGQIARIKGNRYILPSEADLIPGHIQITRHGRGFLFPDEEGLEEIAIPSSQTATAMHDDHVLVRRDVNPRRRRTSEEQPKSGTVVRVLERRRNQIVGTLKISNRLLHVIPDDPRMQHDISVPPASDVGRPARPGDKVVVEIRHWESRHTNPEGEIIEVLGPPTQEGVDMLGVLRQYNLPLKFPATVLQEVKQYGSEVTEADCDGRTDCREHAVVTIDPADAKDFDDAFYLKQTDSGQWKLWVHIADVSHYVKPGSALENEAHERGNSTYLVDRVIPMLPEALSNELCSLKPNVDRLSKCVEFLIDDHGKVTRTKFYSAVIHSQRRYSYEQAMAVLQQSKPKDALENMLQDAGKLAMNIRKRRFHAGSLELDFPETKIHLDSHGQVDKIERLQTDLSHQLIEEFMLLANEAVAGRLMKLKRTSIHRVHEKPDPERLHDYREEVLSHNVPCGDLEDPAQVQDLLVRLGELAIGPALKIGFLKSLMRARYAVEPLGHYGLAKAKYAHFTSPIRRYADLIVHRSLFDDTAGSPATLKKIALHISTTERNSADAERDSKSVKLYAHLEAQLDTGKRYRYQAMVVDVRNFGFFVDVLDLGLSGLVPMSVMEDDFYEFDDRLLRLKGRRTRRVIKLGDQVQVVVVKVNPFKKQVDFQLVPLLGQAKSDRRRPSRKDRTKARDKRKNKGKGKSKTKNNVASKPTKGRTEAKKETTEKKHKKRKSRTKDKGKRRKPSGAGPTKKKPTRPAPKKRPTQKRKKPNTKKD